MAQPLVFYSNAICPFAHRVWLTLIEMGVEFEFKEVSLATIPDWYKPIYKSALGADPTNDEGAVPVIRDGDFVLAESSVIARYIGDKLAAGPLSAASFTAVEKARVQIFVEQHAGNIIGPWYDLLRAQTPEAQAQAKTELLGALKGISAQYSAGAYFLGDRISFADIMWFPWIHRLGVLQHYRGFEVPDAPEFANYHRFVAAMNSRASVQGSARPSEFFIDAYKGYANPAE